MIDREFRKKGEIMYEVMVLTEALKLSDDAVHKGGLWGNMAPPHWHGVAAVYQKGSSIVHSRVERDPGPGRWSSGAIACRLSLAGLADCRDTARECGQGAPRNQWFSAPWDRGLMFGYLNCW